MFACLSWAINTQLHKEFETAVNEMLLVNIW